MGKEQKKTANALYEHLGLIAMKSLDSWNEVELIRIKASNDCDVLISLVAKYSDTEHPLAKTWSTNREVVFGNLGF
jgi:hypothetical protein